MGLHLGWVEARMISCWDVRGVGEGLWDGGTLLSDDVFEYMKGEWCLCFLVFFELWRVRFDLTDISSLTMCLDVLSLM